MSDKYNATLERYLERFGVEPLQPFGASDELLTELMTEALDKGRPIPEDDYFRHLPAGALA